MYEIIDYNTRRRLDTATTREEAHEKVREQRRLGNKDAVWRSTKKQRSDGPTVLRRMLP